MHSPGSAAKLFLISFITGAILFSGCLSEENSAPSAHLSPTPTPPSSPAETIYFFYSPDCPHCENVMPDIVNLSNAGLNIVFCDVESMNEDCTNIGKKINLRGVPTVAVVDSGEIKMYVGESQVKNLIKKLEKSGK
jgi:thiol-disulfide isomerase/thioredoxin